MRHLLGVVTGVFAFLTFFACEEGVEHTAPAINEKDSASVMISYGVNTLISDSGITKYRIVSEQWEVNQARQPSRWIFEKGIFFEQFDLAMHIQSYIQADTAYYYDVMRLWELRGRVRILTKAGVKFSSEQLFWDERSHELYSNKFSHLITPDKELQGNRFRSDERMTKYSVDMGPNPISGKLSEPSTQFLSFSSTIPSWTTPGLRWGNKPGTTDS